MDLITHLLYPTLYSTYDIVSEKQSNINNNIIFFNNWIFFLIPRVGLSHLDLAGKLSAFFKSFLTIPLGSYATNAIDSFSFVFGFLGIAFLI